MRRISPSINELIVFEAVARHGSATKAAAELCVTQGAVSHHLAALESWLGVTLFRRVKQRLHITDAGDNYLSVVRTSLHRIESSTLSLKSLEKREKTLLLACLPTFCAQWLIPRLNRFASAYPDIRLHLVPEAQSEEVLADDQADATIRFGEGAWPDVVADYLTGREVLAVAAPDLAGLIGSLREVTQHTLLHHVSVPHAWEDWRVRAKIKRLNSYVGMRFEQYTTLIQAAVHGLGIGLVPACLVENEIRTGQLVQVDQGRLESWKGYYLCYRADSAKMPAIHALRAWLVEEAGHERNA